MTLMDQKMKELKETMEILEWDNRFMRDKMNDIETKNIYMNGSEFDHEFIRITKELLTDNETMIIKIRNLLETYDDIYAPNQ